MGGWRQTLAPPCLVAMLTVGVTLGGLLAGYEPVGGDPDRLYRPIKSELARSLRQGALPFWSDRFGLGVPLVAESHVAAFYPPNWVLYGAFDVSTGYRLSMWLHYVALAAATYAYARRLGLLPWGSALGAVAFSLCGFQAIHSSHEWAYSTLPFLPLALFLTEEQVANPRNTTLVLLGLTWGAQLTVGHFQIAMWTAGLVVATGVWRSLVNGTRRSIVELPAALACGAAIAAIQLVLSWDYAHLVGSTSRSLPERMFYVYPPVHWPELALPRLFQNLPGGPEDPYWFTQGTTGYEAHVFIGTVPLILACIGLTARGDRALALWRVIVPVSVALATMPVWFPAGYELILRMPGVGYFRAPARFTLIASLGLALLAGRGLDHGLSSRRFAIGLTLAITFGAAATVRAIHWIRLPQHSAPFSQLDAAGVFGSAALVWIASVLALLAWRRRLLGPIGPLVLTAAELGVLYYHGTTVWGRSIDLPNASTVLRQLAQESGRGTVGGDLHDLPVRAGAAPTYPYLGMAMLPPSNALDFVKDDRAAADPISSRLLQRLGMTHAVRTMPLTAPGIDVIYAGPDEVLDRLAYQRPGTPDRRTWYLVRYPETPAVRVALFARSAPSLQAARAYLARDPSTDTAWFVDGDRPVDRAGPRARQARILRWGGLTGEVEHDGICDVIIRRTYAPGWIAQLDGGPNTPVTRVDGGLQSVRLPGAGVTRITLHYRPPHFLLAAAVSAITLFTALLVLGRAARRARAAG